MWPCCTFAWTCSVPCSQTPETFKVFLIKLSVTFHLCRKLNVASIGATKRSKTVCILYAGVLPQDALKAFGTYGVKQVFSVFQTFSLGLGSVLAPGSSLNRSTAQCCQIRTRTYRKGSRPLRFVYKKTPILNPSRLLLSLCPHMCSFSCPPSTPSHQPTSLSWSPRKKVLLLQHNCCLSVAFGRPVKLTTDSWNEEEEQVGIPNWFCLLCFGSCAHSVPYVLDCFVLCFSSFFFGFNDFLFKIVARLQSFFNLFIYFF